MFDDPLARAVLRAELEVPVIMHMCATFPPGPKPGAPKGAIMAVLLVTHRHKPQTRLVQRRRRHHDHRHLPQHCQALELEGAPAQTNLEGAARRAAKAAGGGGQGRVATGTTSAPSPRRAHWYQWPLRRTARWERVATRIPARRRAQLRAAVDVARRMHLRTSLRVPSSSTTVGATPSSCGDSVSSSP